MKRLFLWAVALLPALATFAQDYSIYYKNLPMEMPVPELAQIPDNQVSITDFGGVGDGLTLNTEAFAKAIAALASACLLAFGLRAPLFSRITSTSTWRKMQLLWPPPTARYTLRTASL